MVRLGELLDELVWAVKEKRRERGRYSNARLNEAIWRLEDLTERTLCRTICPDEVRREFCDIILLLVAAGFFRQLDGWQNTPCWWGNQKSSQEGGLEPRADG
jgi:hypothetical protein